MVGGLIVSQVLTLFTTPVIYLAFDRLARPRSVRLRGTAGEGTAQPYQSENEGWREMRCSDASTALRRVLLPFGAPGHPHPRFPRETSIHGA